MCPCAQRPQVDGGAGERGDRVQHGLDSTCSRTERCREGSHAAFFFFLPSSVPLSRFSAAAVANILWREEGTEPTCAVACLCPRVSVVPEGAPFPRAAKRSPQVGFTCQIEWWGEVHVKLSGAH